MHWIWLLKVRVFSMVMPRSGMDWSEVSGIDDMLIVCLLIGWNRLPISSILHLECDIGSCQIDDHA